jgi:hypothetical protein
MSSLLLVFQNSMHVRLRGYCRCHDNWTGRFQPSSATWNWTPTYDSFISHHGKLRFSHPIFVSSTWTQRVRSLVNSLFFWTTYLLDYNYIVVPLPAGFYVSAYLNGEGVLLFLTQYQRPKTLDSLFASIRNNAQQAAPAQQGGRRRGGGWRPAA